MFIRHHIRIAESPPPRVKKHGNEAPCHTQWYSPPSKTWVQSVCLYSVMYNFSRFSHVMVCGHMVHAILLHFAIYIATLSPTWTTSPSLTQRSAKIKIKLKISPHDISWSMAIEKQSHVPNCLRYSSILQEVRHNILQIHNNVLWLWQYSA